MRENANMSVGIKNYDDLTLLVVIVVVVVQVVVRCAVRASWFTVKLGWVGFVLGWGWFGYFGLGWFGLIPVSFLN